MKPEPIIIPKLRDISQDIVNLENRRAAITDLVAKKEAERADLIAAPDEPTPDTALTRAAILLGEAPAQVAPDRKKRLVELAGELRDLREADNLLGAQMRQARSKASAVVRARVEPEFRRRVRTLCLALIEAHRANVELQALKDTLEDDGVEWSSLGVNSQFATGHPRDKYSPIALDLREATRLGLFAKRDVPKELVE